MSFGNEFAKKVLFIVKADYCDNERFVKQFIDKAQVVYFSDKETKSTVLTRKELFTLFQNDFLIFVARVDAHGEINIAKTRMYDFTCGRCPVHDYHCNCDRGVYIKSEPDDYIPDDYVGNLPPITLTSDKPHYFFND